MLTSDLLRTRRQKGFIKPRYLDKRARERMLPIATQLIAQVHACVGRNREQLDAAFDEVPYRPTDRLVALGLRKLLLDRCEFVVSEGLDPVVVRAAVFELSAKAHRALEPRESFDRTAAIEKAAAQLGCTTDAVEQRLYSDLRGNETLTKFRSIEPEALLNRYDVALAQGVLLRATKVVITLHGETAGRARQLFRAARFRGLLHRVVQSDHGYSIELDGPFSLFSAVQKYGLQLALFLPAVLRCQSWELEAAVLWGKKREPLMFALSPLAGLVPHDKRITGVSPELDKFCRQFAKLDSAWDIAENREIIALPGESVCVPDVVFNNRETGEQVFFEAFGFWSRDAVWKRVETLEKARGNGFPARIILAVGKHLRVSEEVLEEGEIGQLYVYKATMSARAILARLEA